MRLLTVTHFYPAHGGGIERVAAHLCRELAAQGHACTWAASAADPAPVLPGVEPLPLTCWNPTEALTGLPMPIPGPRGIAALIRAVRQADAVIIHDALYVTSILALLAARLTGRPAVLVQHIASLEFRARPMRLIMALALRLVTRPMLRAASQVVFISAAVRDAFAGESLRRPAVLAFNGVDTALFHPDTDGEDGGTEPAAAPRPILFVGRFVAKKGLEVIRHCARLRPDRTFVLIGAGPIDPCAWGLANVTVTGPLPAEAVAGQMRAAGLLLLPSSGEGYPLVVQEAMACGLPVICGEDSAAADPAAAPFLHAVRIDPADPEATAQRIVLLLDAPAGDTGQRRAMARYAAATYSWPAMAATIARAAA